MPSGTLYTYIDADAGKPPDTDRAIWVRAVNSGNVIGVIEYNPTSVTAYHWKTALPDVFVGSLVARMYLRTKSGSQGGVVMGLGVYSAPVGSIFDGAFQEVTVTASTTAQSYSNTEATVQASGGAVGLNAGRPLMVRVRRLGTDGGDTHPGSVELAGILFTMVGSQ